MSGSAFGRIEAALAERGFGPIHRGMARCPAHDDRTPSLSVKASSTGVLIQCHAGCDTGDVVRALELEMRDLFDQPRTNGHDGPVRHVVATYVYTDEKKRPLFEVRRHEPKDFRQARIEPDGRRFTGPGCMRGVRLGPYRLSELIATVAAGDPIAVCEGEKDTDQARAAGWAATCNPAGAWKWRPEFGEHFRGAADVRVIADRDREGYRHAANVAENLRANGATVRVFEPAHGKDASDHLAAGRTLDELVEIDPTARLAELEHGVDEWDSDDEPRARTIDLDRVAFTGASLIALLARPAPDPVVAGIPTPGHLTLEIAPAFSGKTSRALWLAMARAAGVAPWSGAPARTAGRVLLFSLDEAPEQVARRMRSLSLFHPAGELERFAENVSVIGPDREIDPEALDPLRFDERGLAILSAWVERAADEGRPSRRYSSTPTRT